MRRAVITGLGVVSCIGNSKDEVLDALKHGRSGIVSNETFREVGLRSQVSGSCHIDLKENIDRKVLRFCFAKSDETLERAAEARAEEMGVEFINLTTEVQDAEAQKAAVDTAITQGVDAIIVGAADSRGWDDSFNKAQKAGIPGLLVRTGKFSPGDLKLGIEPDAVLDSVADLPGWWENRQ